MTLHSNSVSNWFSGLWKKPDDRANIVYVELVNQARTPMFYADLQVPDTVEGRFDMIILHSFALFYRLKDKPEEAQFGQSVFDIMFADMDRSLREMGTGDMGVPKKIKKMGEVFYGRTAAYDKSLQENSLPEMRSAILRNVFLSDPEQNENAEIIAQYIFDSIANLTKQSFSELVAGQINFSDVSQLLSKHKND